MDNASVERKRQIASALNQGPVHDLAPTIKFGEATATLKQLTPLQRRVALNAVADVLSEEERGKHGQSRDYVLATRHSMGGEQIRRLVDGVELDSMVTELATRRSHPIDLPPPDRRDHLRAVLDNYEFSEE